MFLNIRFKKVLQINILDLWFFAFKIERNGTSIKTLFSKQIGDICKLRLYHKYEHVRADGQNGDVI